MTTALKKLKESIHSLRVGPRETLSLEKTLIEPWTREHPNKGRDLLWAERADLLREIIPSRLFDPKAVATELNDVHIEVEEFIFAEAALEEPAKTDLLQLTTEGLLFVQEDLRVSRQQNSKTIFETVLAGDK